ncbi:hypothetical protein V7150_00905 [Neobacillus drentensis]|uniref:hypothetical protein n=1 Tax=Neobacillus drentensis TaxID=220684 RepID=UPI002FFD99EF
MIISEEIRKIIEGWNPYGLEDSIYGIESFEIYKCIKGSNNSNKSNPEEIAFYVQKVLEGYAEGCNKEFSLEYNKCLVIAKKINKVIESNANDI